MLQNNGAKSFVNTHHGSKSKRRKRQTKHCDQAHQRLLTIYSVWMEHSVSWLSIKSHKKKMKKKDRNECRICQRPIPCTIFINKQKNWLEVRFTFFYNTLITIQSFATSRGYLTENSYCYNFVGTSSKLLSFLQLSFFWFRSEIFICLIFKWTFTIYNVGSLRKKEHRKC